MRTAAIRASLSIGDLDVIPDDGDKGAAMQLHTRTSPARRGCQGRAFGERGRQDVRSQVFSVVIVEEDRRIFDQRCREPLVQLLGIVPEVNVLGGAPLAMMHMAFVANPLPVPAPENAGAVGEG
jgi:hypothetical protein